MADILVYDTSTGFVKDYKKSENTVLYVDRTDVLINPVLPGPLDNCIVDKGQLRLMTSDEKLLRDTAYKLEHYEELRSQAYPPMEAQLDAILKQFNYDRLNGKTLIQEMDDILGQWLQAKEDYPKPGP